MGTHPNSKCTTTRLAVRNRWSAELCYNEAVGALFLSSSPNNQREQARSIFHVGEWLSLVEHLVRDQGVGGSNPLSPTNLLSSPKILSVCDSPVWFAASEAHG